MSATAETMPVTAHPPVVAADEARRDKIVQHLVAQVGAVKVEDQPFQHFYLQGMFPADIYAEMLANLPARSSYRPLNIKRWHNDKGESTRDQLFLSEGELARVEAPKRDLWADVTAALESDELRRAVFARMSHDIALRLECSADEVTTRPMYPSVSLVRDFEDYMIKPHPDGYPRTVTMQFYLPKDETQTELGTSLYKKLPVHYRLLGRSYDEVKRFKFLPNSGYAFAVNDRAERQSYHGREVIGASSGIRDTIILMWLSSPMAFANRHNSDAY